MTFLPTRAAIIARIADLRGDAFHQSDSATVRQLDLLTTALDAGMLFTWNDDGDLCIASASTPGLIYRVSCGVCTCPARKPCKHLALYEILITLADEAATDADLEADCDEAAPQPWIIGALFRRLRSCDPPNEPCPLGSEEGDTEPAYRPLGPRLCAARANYAWAA